ncbi:lanthionine synthetase LanC family protein [Bacteriovorax sp. Seq25_V]|uniref:lanthionine synthetase LanC family protein n=1 Tax=Bacteriovorax sp. Seq25_V TaxID=1201288 RepID=UPI00038A1E5D|nr:lanthionine synthetase LanC family protein [Bacteriovorax sp. Seq25_V]EQC45337.1 lanthionine synthetase C-like protein [Bacteriovorax sp. Seq25_V]
MLEKEYLDYAASYYDKYYDFVQKHGSTSINHGFSGLLLYHLQRFQALKNVDDFKKTKDIIGHCLKNLDDGFGETSFFLGPLGVVWSLYLAEEVFKKTIIDHNRIDAILLQYLVEQKEFLNHHSGVLDFIYGVTGWYIIYPYLNSSLQTIVKEVFFTQFSGFDISRIGKVVYDGEDRLIEYSSDHVGFAHGLSSIIYVSRKLDFDNSFEACRNEMLHRVKTSLNSDFELARTFGGNDYTRQDWCHGMLGVLNIIPEIKDEVLARYWKRNISFHDHGLCHGLGQKVIIPKIYDGDFVPFEIPNMSLKTNVTDLSFIQTPLVTEMALRFDKNRDFNFTWWRLFYP